MSTGPKRLAVKSKIAAISLSLILAPATGHSQAPTQIAGIYSDLRYVEEAGDLLGTEIFIVPSAGGMAYVAFVQEAEGGPEDPVIVPVVQKGNQVSIRARMYNYTMQFDGQISPKSFDGKLTTTVVGGKKSAQPFQLREEKSCGEGP